MSPSSALGMLSQLARQCAHGQDWQGSTATSVGHACPALFPGSHVSVELHLLPRIREPLFQTTVSSVDAISVSTLVTGPGLNFLSLLLGLAVFYMVVRGLGNSRPRATVLLEGGEPAEVSAAADEQLANVSLLDDQDETLDESAIITPSGTLSFVDISSFKASNSGVISSASSVSLDSPAFRNIWKKNASAAASIAHKRSRAIGVTAREKLQRWASKRHEHAAQEAVVANQKTHLTPLSPIQSGAQGSLGPSRPTEEYQSSAYVKVISPRAERKLRVRRASLRAISRELEAIHATLDHPGDPQS